MLLYRLVFIRFAYFVGWCCCCFFFSPSSCFYLLRIGLLAPRARVSAWRRRKKTIIIIIKITKRSKRMKERKKKEKNDAAAAAAAWDTQKVCIHRLIDLYFWVTPSRYTYFFVFMYVCVFQFNVMSYIVRDTVSLLAVYLLLPRNAIKI